MCDNLMAKDPDKVMACDTLGIGPVSLKTYKVKGIHWGMPSSIFFYMLHLVQRSTGDLYKLYPTPADLHDCEKKMENFTKTKWMVDVVFWY